ncbi:unnamed protein product [Nesidiocoris tenuis]|uniref:Retrotransposon gag domain-containing protein n=1 Tax=Nesidiocoris tenuis TaxID=355587 RepID=A0A6H5H6C2_9HEMI|nr:unnamed protein product [Nesidiocoris tenuis]
MSDARPPRVFNFDADNLKKEWEDWHQNFEIYLTASKKHAESNPVKIAMLLNQLGYKGVELYNALKADAEITSTVETKEAALSKYTDVVSAFATHFAPRKNVLHERCKFNKLNLNSGQSLIEYVTALKNAAASCEFLERNNMIRDRLISQVPDEALLNRLLDEGDTLTLERTIDLCKLHDARKMEIQDFTNGENKIDAVRNFNRGSNRFRKPNKNLKVESKNVGNAEKCTGRRSEAYQCKKCGYTHTAGKCPAYGKTCSFCRKLHHFEIGCKIKKSAIQPRRTHAITEPSEESDDSLYLGGYSVTRKRYVFGDIQIVHLPNLNTLFAANKPAVVYLTARRLQHRRNIGILEGPTHIKSTHDKLYRRLLWILICFLLKTHDKLSIINKKSANSNSKQSTSQFEKVQKIEQSLKIAQVSYVRRPILND